MAQREIKFRAWLEYYHEKGFMDYFELNPQGELFINVFGEDKISRVSSDYVTLEQYTGRKDYNSVDIYENDLAKFTSSQSGDEPKVKVGVVKFEDYTWVVTSGKNVEYLSNEVSIIEVIGNIHENPELLEAEQ